MVAFLLASILLQKKQLGSSRDRHAVIFIPVIKLDEYKKATWHIVPANTPVIIKHCSKCNRKNEYYCSEKFRVNANQARVDIWLIYKCNKCDSTWKLAIKKGVRPRDLPAGLFDKFVNNDRCLAWQYAFDRHFLKQHSCVIDYANVEYSVRGYDRCEGPLLVHIKSLYCFELKLGTLLANVLCMTVGQIKKLAESGAILASPEIDIVKHKIKSDIDVLLRL